MSDYAILVGISHYPNPGFSDLGSPPIDVALFEEWLRSPTGGGIVDEPGQPHLIRLLTPKPYPKKFQPDKAPPTQYQFELCYRRLRHKLSTAPGRRLYLYFSGHGFAERQRSESHAAVYTADSDNSWASNIFGTLYARKALKEGLCAEVVLVMDCCRDSEINRKAAEPPMDESFDEGVAAKGKLLAFYAAPFGGKAQERPIAEAGNTVHGLLTYALVKALREAPCDASGRLTGQQLKNFIYAAWDKLFPDNTPDTPKIQTPEGEDIVFATPPQRQGFARRISLRAPISASADLVVRLGAQFVELFTCRLRPPGQTSIIEFPDGTTRPLDFDGRTLTLRLPGGMYDCELCGVASPRTATLIVRGDGSDEL